MIASAQTIRNLAPIFPLKEKTIFNGMSYGLSAAGYDIRIAQTVIIPPHGFVLASAIEFFNITDQLLGIVHDKSTWARRGLSVFNTVIEPGWKGYLTLELKNQGDARLKIIAGSPIAQVVFHILDKPTELPYSGKYQNQSAGSQPAIMENENE